MKIVAFFLFSMMVAAPAVVAQQSAKRPMTFADLMAMKRVSDPQISPSGQWVLFSVTDVSLEKNSKTNHLWSVPLQGGPRVEGQGSSEKQVTFGSGEAGGRFSPDGKWVIYSASVEEGPLAGKGEIFVAPWDEAKGAVGAGRAVTALETEADGGIWAPDSKHFLFVSEVYPACESKVPAGAEHNQQEAECNAAADAAAAKDPVKAQVFTELLYTHWDHYQGAKRSHVFWSSLPGAGEQQIPSEDDNKKDKGNGKGGAIAAPKDLTPMSVVGDRVAPTYSVGGPLGYAVAPDGKEVAYVVNLDKVPAESTNIDIFVLDPEGDVHAAKKVSTSPGSDDGPQYSPDGKWLAWRSQARNGYESDKFDLVVMDRGSGAIRNLTSRFDSWVDEFAWRPDSKWFVFASPFRGEEDLYTVNLDGPHFNTFAEGAEFSSVVTGTMSEDFGRLIAGNSVLVAVEMSVGRPAEVAMIQGSDTPRLHEPTPMGRGSMEGPMGPISGFGGPITHLNDALVANVDLPKMESFWFSGANGTKVEGFLIRPPHFDPAKKYPLKFLIHGGPQGAWGDAWSYRWNPELLAADGYVVVMINPRGSTGYGQKFLEEVSGDWGGRPFVDLMKGLDYAEAKYPFIDTTRECALGASYGGFMANWILTHTDRFKCIVTHDGMYNPQSAFGDTEELWFNEWEFRPLAGARGKGLGIREQGLGKARATATEEADPAAAPQDDNKKSKSKGNGDKQILFEDDNKEGKGKGDDSGDAVVEQRKAAHPWDFYDRAAGDDPFRRWSPMLSIKNAKTPTLVVHSQKDYRLDVSEGMQLFTALQLLGVPSKMLYFPDEGHWVLKPRNSELWYRTVNDWCDRWTGSGVYAGQGQGSIVQGSRAKGQGN